MPRKTTARLTAAQVKSLSKPRKYPDGDGLYLRVRSRTAKSWLYRYMRNGKAREMGLGPATGPAAFTLAEARKLARDAQIQLRDGIDPIEARKAARSAVEDSSGAKPFSEVAELYLKAHEPSWRNAKHKAQWRSTLQTYVFPHLGHMPVSEVNTHAVMNVLNPIWHKKTETASRVRGRIEAVLDYAAVMNWRSGDNPARWRGHISKLLPARSKVSPTRHRPALPWEQISAFMKSLHKQQGVAARALEITILTAARSSEVINMKWTEVDLDKKIWTIPAVRMKAGRTHRVPLSEPAIAVLRQMKSLISPHSAGYVFPGNRRGKPISNMAMLMLLRRMKHNETTVHGFRSTFRDWCREATNYSRDIAEAALAHTLDRTEGAYARGDVFTKRIDLMAEWANRCGIVDVEQHRRRGRPKGSGSKDIHDVVVAFNAITSAETKPTEEIIVLDEDGEPLPRECAVEKKELDGKRRKLAAMSRSQRAIAVAEKAIAFADEAGDPNRYSQSLAPDGLAKRILNASDSA